MLVLIAERIERSDGAGYADDMDLRDERQKTVLSPVVMANELKAKGILMFTRFNRMAQ